MDDISAPVGVAPKLLLPRKPNMEPEHGPLEKEIPALEAILFIFRFHVSFGVCV